jgi:hypothetical protein
MPTFKPGLKPPFSGHGFYVYDLEDVLKDYGSTAAVVSELQRLKIDHLWLRIHGRNYVGSHKNTNLALETAFADSARAAGIAVAGWGWCQGEDIPKEIALAKKAISTFAVDHYVADIEQGENGAQWTKQEVQQFLGGVRPTVVGLGFTSYGFIDGHAPELLQAAASHVDMINPQAYWYMNYPKASMLSQTGTTGKYPLANAAGYAAFCRDRYEHWAPKPVVVSGQAYAEGDFDSNDAVAKLTQFFSDFDRYGDICGLNWWHLGAANKAMRDVIAAHMQVGAPAPVA